MKRGLESYTALQLGTSRIAISFVFLLPFAIYRIRKLKRKHVIYFILVGFIGSAFPAILFAKAQTVLDSQIAGILNSVSPLFTLIIGVLFFSFKTKWFNVLGVVIGLAGAVGLLWAANEKGFSLNFGYGMYIILATLFYAININIIKKYLKDVDAVTIAAFAFMAIGIPAIIILFTTDFSTRLMSGTPALINFGYISILAIVGTALALMLYNYLIKISSILFRLLSLIFFLLLL
jgi:drug/metabolite transporter (DMT)-like permease